MKLRFYFSTCQIDKFVRRQNRTALFPFLFLFCCCWLKNFCFIFPAAAEDDAETSGWQNFFDLSTAFLFLLFRLLRSRGLKRIRRLDPTTKIILKGNWKIKIKDVASYRRFDFKEDEKNFTSCSPPHRLLPARLRRISALRQSAVWHVNPGALLSQPIADETSPQPNFFLSFLLKKTKTKKKSFKLIIFLSKQKKKMKKSDWRLDYKMNC